MPITVKNLFADLPSKFDAEDFLTLCESSAAKIERIVSHSHASPPGFWHDQAEDEWVMILSGSATLEFEGNETVELKTGDYLIIPRHLKHRVARTSEETIWLSVFAK
jgi:cupin 2 domain-containing protein